MNLMTTMMMMTIIMMMVMMMKLMMLIMMTMLIMMITCPARWPRSGAAWTTSPSARVSRPAWPL